MSQLTPKGYKWIQVMESYCSRTIHEVDPSGCIHVRSEPVGNWQWVLVKE